MYQSLGIIFPFRQLIPVAEAPIHRSKIRAFFILDPGTAYIDFGIDAFDNHPGGVGNELLSVYSVVNSLILNSEVIRSVQFLIGGQEAATLALQAITG